MMLAVGCSSPSGPATPASPSPGGAVACTEIGCGPAFIVDFERPEPWARGVYGVEVVVDGDAFTCPREIPLTCDDDPACPRPDVQLIEIGCALGVGEQALGGLQFIGDPPAHVEVRVLENDEEIGQGSFDPAYTESQPNGPECEPTCTQAPNAAVVLGPTAG